jgi:hypothetical protein
MGLAGAFVAPAARQGIMDNLKVKQKTEDMIKYGYIALRQFPKSEKFTLALDIKRTMFAMLEQIIRANRARDKREALYGIDTELEILRTQVRLAMELQFLPFGKYEVWSGHLAELGRMIGGWLKSLKKG